jgi:hypothetical protein
MAEAGDTPHARSEDRSGPGARWHVLLAAAVIVGLVAWRATLGMSFQDDGYYAAATLRLAQGARLFVDEVFVQSTGFLAAVPFAKLWAALFGTTGIVVALRLLYVASAAAGAALVYRLLRPSFGVWASLAGAAAPLLAPAYHLFGVTYDTMAALGLMLACVLAFAAARDERPWLAAAAGVAAAVASISYPPLTIAAVTLLITVAVQTRDRALVRAMALGAAAVVAVFLAWLLSQASLAELGVAFRAIVAGWNDMPRSVHGNRIGVGLWELAVALGGSWLVPLWAWFLPAAVIDVGSALPAAREPRHRRTRGIALGLLPLALALPVLADQQIHGRGPLWTLAGNYLIAFIVFAAPAVFARFVRERSVHARFLRMAIPVGCSGFLVVILSSNASIHWGSAVVGLAPLAVAVVACWIEEIGESVSPRTGAVAAAALLVALLAVLFGSSYKDGAPLTLTFRLTEGVYAGITTNRGHSYQIAEFRRLAARWITPSTTVAAVELPGAFLLTGGVPLTDAVYLNTGAAGGFAAAYYDRLGRWPDILWVPLFRTDQPAAVSAADPFMSQLYARYRLVERAPLVGIEVFALKTTTGQPAPSAP